MDVQDIITEFGAYYINQGQNLSRLVKILNEKSVTENAFTTVVTDDTLYRGGKSTIGRLLQPFQKGWTPIGNVGFTPIAIPQYPFKMDHEEYPDDLEATWLGFLADESLNRSEWPFIRWLVEVHLLPQIKEDYELNEIFSGVYVAPTPGTAGAAGTAMNGIKEIRNTHISDGRITPITIGALETDPQAFVEQIESFSDQINTRYWMQNMELNMSQTLAKRYRRGYRKLYGKDTDFDGVKSSVEDTNIMVVGKPSHEGSDIIWCTPKSNAIRLLKKSQNMNRVRIETAKREVSIFTDFYSGIGFLIPEIVFTNDSELPV
ncbi:hypothetical protein DN752_21060 [Echinicola strongylocentroti]|uniref:Major capsid protein n=1 Tax=Echinicola strongylocentroti TaxID=1795355 RepID=A0A2Z4IQ64_9BACT|nr:hypothetical protein [Echinicola strongylocentroti]AWW32433.1 hypothetical protein DN752_21060 [Echinicola strongylocentroti]